MKPKLPFVLATEREVETFLREFAGHFFCEYMQKNGERPPNVIADAMGHALRRAMCGLPIGEEEPN